MKKNIFVITGARSDYGLLRETIKKLSQEKNVNLKLIVTGSHLSKELGNTYKEIERDGFCNFEKLKIKLGNESKESMSFAIANTIEVFTNFFKKNIPDMLVVLGDRYEIFGAVIAASTLGIKIAHISGGDITEGAIDDCFRNSITQFSVLHFPGCEDSRKRIIAMGKNPNAVFNVGEPGIENCLNIQEIEKGELSKDINFDLNSDFAIVTYHPETVGNRNIKKDINELIKAMNHFNMNYIITMANADAGGKIINSAWEKECKKHKNWLLVSSLGVNRYINCLRYSKLIIGNSSSGIVEAPTIGVPTVNIGNRQNGRMMSKSVMCCDNNEKEIIDSIKKALQLKKHKYYLYGDGKTSEKIVKHILEYLDK